MKTNRGQQLLILAVVVLLLTNAYLFWQNNHYQHRNRALILQNDSILSVNLELKQKDLKTANSTALQQP